MGNEETWQIVHQERAALANDLQALPTSAWSIQSFCTEWTIHDVLAHLVNDAKTTKAGFFRELVMARFDFDRLNQRGLARERKSSSAETLASFRTVMDRTTGAPAPVASRLVEVIVHGEDIRRPLGIDHTYPTEAILQGIRYQIGASTNMGGSKEKAAGVRLVATDADFAHGEGLEARGTALDLLLALTGRESGFNGLTGDGIGKLRHG